MTTPDVHDIITVQLDLYRGAKLWAACRGVLPVVGGSFAMFAMPSLADSIGHYQVTLHLAAETVPTFAGWVAATVELEINGGTLVGTRVPMPFYLAEPTTFPTGIARWMLPQPGRENLPPVHWMLNVRRAQ